MNAKDWLMRAWRIDEEINSLEEAKRRAFDRATSTTAAPDGEIVSATKDPHRKLDSYAEYVETINEKIEDLVTVEREVAQLISRVPSKKLRTILTHRYLNFRTFEQIGDAMHYSTIQISRLHREALTVVDAMLRS